MNSCLKYKVTNFGLKPFNYSQLDRWLKPKAMNEKIGVFKFIAVAFYGTGTIAKQRGVARNCRQFFKGDFYIHNFKLTVNVEDIGLRRRRQHHWRS
jgi:hypothetical protein